MSTPELASQAGRTFVITGANSGLGLVTARALAAVGAHVVLAVRDPARGKVAAEDIERRTSAQVEVRRLDLADLASVRRFAAEWGERPFDVLINNAGVAHAPRRRTVDGFELHIGTNHLGHFALTRLLLPQVTDRVVTVASHAHRRGSVDLTDLSFDRRPYRPRAAYAQSKLANLLFTLELQRRLAARGSRVRALAAHPGIVATNLHRRLGPVKSLVAATAGRLVLSSDEAGAWPLLYAAVQDLPGGGYVGPGGLGERYGAPALVGRSAAASDPRLAQELWRLSEELTEAGLAARR